VRRVAPRDYAVEVEVAIDKLVRASDTLNNLHYTIRSKRPYHPVWSTDFTKALATAGTYIYEARRHLEEARLDIIAEVLEYAGMGLDDLYMFLKNVEGLCNLVWKQGLIVHPNPCKHTGSSSKLKDVALDFEKAIRFLQGRKTVDLIGHVDELALRDPLLYIRSASEHLSTFYSRCEAILGRECTTFKSEIADNLNLPLETLAMDIAIRLEYITTLLVEKYSDLTTMIINNVPIFYHPIADPELLEAVIMWAHASAKLRQKVGVYADIDSKALVAVVLEDYMWIKLSSTTGHFAIVRRPRWTIEYHSIDVNANSVLERLYKSRGFIVEPTGYGLKVTVPPGKLKEFKEALAILALSTSMDLRMINKSLEEAYKLEKARMDKLLEELKIL
jgi:hypothetical protein